MMFLKKAVLLVLAVGCMASVVPTAWAENTDPPARGKISGRSVVAGLLSFVVWPGIGQAVNSDGGKKVATHAVLGLIPPYRFWSGYDALVDRHGGYWNGKI